jgi:hypothetical protein
MPHLAVCGMMMALLLGQARPRLVHHPRRTTLAMLFVAGAKLSYILLALLSAAPVSLPQHRLHRVAPAAHPRLPRPVAVPE